MKSREIYIIRCLYKTNHKDIGTLNIRYGAIAGIVGILYFIYTNLAYDIYLVFYFDNIKISIYIYLIMVLYFIIFNFKGKVMIYNFAFIDITINNKVKDKVEVDVIKSFIYLYRVTQVILGNAIKRGSDAANNIIVKKGSGNDGDENNNNLNKIIDYIKEHYLPKIESRANLFIIGTYIRDVKKLSALINITQNLVNFYRNWEKHVHLVNIRGNKSNPENILIEGITLTSKNKTVILPGNYKEIIEPIEKYGLVPKSSTGFQGIITKLFQVDMPRVQLFFNTHVRQPAVSDLLRMQLDKKQIQDISDKILVPKLKKDIIIYNMNGLSVCLYKGRSVDEVLEDLRELLKRQYKMDDKELVQLALELQRCYELGSDSNKVLINIESYMKDKPFID